MSKHQQVSHIHVQAGQAGQRLDNFLFKHLKDIPKSRIYKALRKGEIRANKKRVKAEYRIQEGDDLRLPPFRFDEKPEKKQPNQAELDRLLKSILYQDEDLLIIDKPSGMAVHGGSGVDYGVIDTLRMDNPQLELAHRLDRETSGCLILAKHRHALLRLQELLQNEGMLKEYLAITKGPWSKPEMVVDEPLAKAEGHKLRDAKTSFEVLASHDGYALVRAELHTGRTHQIRKHAANVGCPVLGDDQYGERKFNHSAPIKRLCLHAEHLKFEWGDKVIDVTAKMPIEFKKIKDLS